MKLFCLIPNNINVIPYIAVVILAIVVAFFPQEWQQNLEFHREYIADGQYWRLITAHVVHSNYWHLAMNVAGFLLVMLLHSHYYKTFEHLTQWLIFSVLISLSLYTYSPSTYIYVGLSGLIHAMLLLGALKDIQYKQITGKYLLAGLLIKVAYEQWHGSDEQLANLIEASVAIDSHLYGVLSGLWIGVVFYLRYQAKKNMVQY